MSDLETTGEEQIVATDGVSSRSRTLRIPASDVASCAL